LGLEKRYGELVHVYVHVPPMFFGGKELWSRTACVVSITTSVRSHERVFVELWLHLPKRLLYRYSNADKNKIIQELRTEGDIIMNKMKHMDIIGVHVLVFGKTFGGSLDRSWKWTADQLASSPAFSLLKMEFSAAHRLLTELLASNVLGPLVENG
jgi:hypothetical protein